MAHVQTSPPAVEPISLAEAKAFLRVDTTTEDALIDALIRVSRLQIEDTLDIALIHQTWSHVFDRWPDTLDVTLPIAPAVQLLAVRTYDINDVATSVPLTTVQLDAVSRTPRVIRKTAIPLPAAPRSANTIEISYRAGYGAAATDVPEPLRQALRLLVAHWYDHRNVAGAMSDDAKIPSAISALLAPYRRPRLV